MGLFDLFKGGSRDKGEKRDPNAVAAAKWAERAGDKRAQNYDRQEAIATLSAMKTSEAAAALLKRFTFTIDPSITDQDEKDTAFEGVVAAGEKAIEPVRAFSTKAASLAWPMRILKELVSEEAYVEELLGWLARWDTEYSKLIDPKIQLLVELEEHKHARIREAVAPFLGDVNETARFHAAATSFAQGDAAAVPALLSTLLEDESFRIKNKIADGFVATGWSVPDEQRDAVRKALPPGYSIDGAGKVRKR
ncbi:MAG TPA: HEAT repeat domain-containing protein [Polyangiaceae bacterium]|nr:HEAT repeat domain-containing protein [Polyangiaceae bacterium]